MTLKEGVFNVALVVCLSLILLVFLPLGLMAYLVETITRGFDD